MPWIKKDGIARVIWLSGTLVTHKRTMLMKRVPTAAVMLSIAGVFTLVACAREPSPDQTAAVHVPDIDGEAIQAHVALLADDLYEGREAGKRGYALAAKYVATQFRTMGLAPGNNGSYFQSVPFQVAKIVEGSRALTVSSASGEREYATFSEYAQHRRWPARKSVLRHRSYSWAMA